MIGRLKGILIEAAPGRLLMDVGGVGYVVEVPLSTYFQVAERKDEIVLHIQMIVREDVQLLFGFYTRAERDLFCLLIKVNSVGPKLAINVLSGIAPPEFVQVVTNQDVKSLVALPGVGKKTAQKIILELKDRLSALGIDAPRLSTDAVKIDHFTDAEGALIGLGFKPQDASRALAHIEASTESADHSVESLIKQALKVLT